MNYYLILTKEWINHKLTIFLQFDNAFKTSCITKEIFQNKGGIKWLAVVFQ